VATVNSAGINRVKPSDDFMLKANAISRMPAMLSNAHAIWDRLEFPGFCGESMM